MRKVRGDSVGSLRETGKALRVLLHEADDPPSAARLEAVRYIHEDQPGGGRLRWLCDGQ